MIDRSAAKIQVMRLGQLRYFPKDNPEALKDLVRVMAEASSEHIAGMAVSALLDTATAETYCPLPGQLRELFKSVENPITEAQEQRTRDCLVCGGTGLEIIERNGLTGARNCGCRK